jgi:amidase
MSDILQQSGIAQAKLIREGSISSEELVQLHLDRIDKINPSVNAVVEVLRDSALASARRVDADRRAGEPLGPFAGVPFSIKDSIEVEGRVCSAGTLGYRNAPASACDATLVRRLRSAGAIPLARTNLPDLLFAFESDNLIFGRTNNPYDLSRTSGGSSGGEAALIACCGSPFGLGSDAAGSVRVPAHYCGIASLKPTSGRLSRRGHVPPPGGWIEAIWQIGPMARHVEDLWAMMPILLGTDPGDRTVVPMPFHDPALVPIQDLRIAYFTDNGISRPDANSQAVVQCAAAELTATEHRPPGIERSYELEMKFLGADGGDGLRDLLRSIGSDRTHPLLEGWLSKLEPFRTNLAGFAQYWAELDEFRAGMHSFLSNYDAILSPVAAHTALPHGTSTEEQNLRGFSYTMTYNLTGWPAAVVRCGETRDGLPVGVQIAAAPWREDIVLALARRIETAFGGHQSFETPFPSAMVT